MTHRPSKTELEEFRVILKKVEEMLKSLKKIEAVVIWSRDFNFHFVNGKNKEHTNVIDLDLNLSSGSAGERKQLIKVIKLC